MKSNTVCCCGLGRGSISDHSSHLAASGCLQYVFAVFGFSIFLGILVESNT